MKLTALAHHPVRRYSLFAAVLAVCLIGPETQSSAQTVSSDANYQVVQRGQDVRVHQKTISTTDPVTGVVTSQVSSYQELGNGLCYQAFDGSWTDSQDLVEVTAGGAQAVHGPFPANFAADIASPNPITLFPPATASASSQPIQL